MMSPTPTETLGRDISSPSPPVLIKSESRGITNSSRYTSITELQNDLDKDTEFTVQEILSSFAASSLTRKHYSFRTATSAMSSSRSGRSGGSSSHRNSKGTKKLGGVYVNQGFLFRSVQQLIETLETHRVNTLTELCRIERVAATCDNEADAVAFQSPMTRAWEYYVTTNQLLVELRGLTPNYPICCEILQDAQVRVRNDPESNKSWNMAWLCLKKMEADGLVSYYAALEALKPQMWGGRAPTADEAAQLTACFEYEWNAALSIMLRHWSDPPTWY